MMGDEKRNDEIAADMGIETVIRSIPGLMALKGAGEEEILSAEQSLGLRFSEEYVEYLHRFGCICFGSHEFTGLNVSDRLNVIAVTKFERQIRGNSFPLSAYVIESTGDGAEVILQDQEGVIYKISDRDGVHQIAASLVEYLQALGC